MTRTYEGSLNARGLRVAIVASRFNDTIARRLVEGALDCLRRHGARDEDLSVVWVPGAFELPSGALRMARSGEFDAVVCLGAVIRGETAHFDYVAGESAGGIGRVALETGIPVANGILTCDTSEQAAERAGGKLGNKGFDAALAAVEMAALFQALPKAQTDL